MTFKKHISSAANDEMKTLARLLDTARERRKHGVVVLEGIHLLQSALAAGWQPKAVYVNEGAAGNGELLSLLARIDPHVCHLVATAVLTKVTALATPAEVLAICERPTFHIEEVAGTCIMLDDIQDPGNLGTILRCAAAANVREVFLSKGCVDVYSPKVMRAGMGAHFFLNIHEAQDLPARLAARDGLKLVTHLEGSVSLYSQNLSGPVAFVFGNEGNGVSTAVLEQADVRVRIPMPGHAESLNVAMAATVCLFERVRQLEG